MSELAKKIESAIYYTEGVGSIFGNVRAEYVDRIRASWLAVIESIITVPEGHVRLPSGDQSLPWKVIHVASNEVVASFKWGDVAQTYIKRGIEIGGWHEHELRLQQAAESARAGGGA